MAVGEIDPLRLPHSQTQGGCGEREVALASRHLIQHLRKEHEKLLHLTVKIERMLELASKNVFAEHLKGLNGLRSLKHGLAGIEEHCRAGTALSNGRSNTSYRRTNACELTRSTNRSFGPS